MRLSRRTVFSRLVAGLVGSAGLWRASAEAAETTPSEVPKVAYHLADLDKVTFVIGNIENHIAGMGGPDKVTIVLVVHGPALAMFRTSKANPDIVRRVAGIAADGVGLAACGNTLAAQEIDVSDLLPGFVRVDEGGVTRLAKLQAEGYAYLRP